MKSLASCILAFVHAPFPLTKCFKKTCSVLIFAVPLVTIFTKFDAQIIQEYGKLDDLGVYGDKWAQARTNAEKFYKEVYVSKVQESACPPKEYVVLEGENNTCC